MVDSFTVQFANGRAAKAVQVHNLNELPDALEALGLRRTVPTMVLIGGAGRLSAADLDCLHPLFTNVIAPVVESLGAGVVDGGTDAGVMRLMGQARAEVQGTFPLIGVAAVGTVDLPGSPQTSPSSAPLEPFHTHIVLVPGSKWGDEVAWISDVAAVLAAEAPTVTVLVSGGRIAYEDAAESIFARRPVIAIHGSGGTADELASALCDDAPDGRARSFVESGLLRGLDISDNPDTIVKVIEEHLVVEKT